MNFSKTKPSSICSAKTYIPYFPKYPPFKPLIARTSSPITTTPHFINQALNFTENERKIIKELGCVRARAIQGEKISLNHFPIY